MVDLDPDRIYSRRKEEEEEEEEEEDRQDIRGGTASSS